ncbi:MAG TPA: DUF6541 family protein [Jatrophihabitans sp.]
MKFDVLLWLIATLLPGIAAIRLSCPALDWRITVAAAPPVSFGLLYAVGLAATRLSVSTLGAVLAIATLLVLTAVVVEVRRWPVRTADDAVAGRPPRMTAILQRSPAELTSWLMLIAAVALGLALWRSFEAHMYVPVGWDAMHHGFFIRQIVRYDTLHASVVLASDPSGHDGAHIYYPLAFNLVTAALHVSSGAAISQLMLASMPAMAGVLLPIGVYCLVRELDRSRPMVAGFAAVASVLPILLYMISGTGRITGILGPALVPGAVLLLISQRLQPKWRVAPVAALALVGIIGLHTSELPTVALAAAVFVLVLLWQHGTLAALRHWALWAVTTGLGALVLVVVLEPNVIHLAGERTGALVGSPNQSTQNVMHSALTVGANFWAVLALGCLLPLHPRWRRYAGPAVVYLLFAMLYFLLGVGAGEPWSTLAVPWYGDVGRVSWDMVVLSAMPTGVAFAAVFGFAGKLVAAGYHRLLGAGEPSPDTDRSEPVRGWVAPIATLVIGALFILAFALPPVSAKGALVSRVVGPVQPDSIAAFRYLARTVPPGEHVLDDLRTDGAMWMYVDHGVQPVFGSSPLLGAAPSSWKQRLWLRNHIDNIATDPCVRDVLNEYSVHYIYVGDRRIFDGWRDFRANTLSKISAFTGVFNQGNVHIFRINPASSAPCTMDVTAGVRW